MFGFGRKAVKKIGAAPEDAHIPEAAEGFSTAAEDATGSPAIELIPVSWSRNKITAGIRAGETAQAVKAIAGIVTAVAAAGAICLGLMFRENMTESRLERQRKEISELIGEYDKSVSRAYGMDGILKYTQELSLAEQARALINICVSSGIAVHKLDLTHDTDLIPSNVRNSFEASTSLKLDKVKIHGVWIVDGSFTGSRAEIGNEQWILSINKTFASMFKGTRYSTFMDMSGRAGRPRDGRNRYEFVFLFWDASDSKKGAANN